MEQKRPAGNTDRASDSSHKSLGSQRPWSNRLRDEITPPLVLSIGLLAGGGLVLALLSWQEEKKEIQRNEVVRVEAGKRAQDSQRLEETIHKAEERIRAQITDEMRTELEKKRALQTKGINYEQAWEKWYKPNRVCQRSNLKWKELVDCGNELIEKRTKFDALYRAGKLKIE